MMDGKSVAKETEDTLKVRVQKLKEEKGFIPTLATILVGNDPASATYVKMKGNACERVGMKSLKVELPEETTTDQLLKKIEELEKQLADLKLELTQAKPKKSDRLSVGEEVNVLNPGRGQESQGTISKVNYKTGRATVSTTKGKISRVFKNLERK